MDVKEGGRASERLVTLLVKLNKAIHKRSTEEMLGMSLKSYMALGYVRDHAGATQQELERALFMDANSVVLMLNELEARQFSIRRRDPQDRRRHILEMTPSGLRALERADKAREDLEQDILAGMSPEERKTFRKLVERALENLLQPVS